MGVAKLKSAIPILDVRDMDRALNYYVERLGFQVEFRYEADPSNYAGVIRDGVRVYICNGTMSMNSIRERRVD
jgi:hypothetical protein